MNLSGKCLFHQGLASFLSWPGHQGVTLGSSLDHARLDPVGSSWIDQQRDPSRAAIGGLAGGKKGSRRGRKGDILLFNGWTGC